MWYHQVLIALLLQICLILHINTLKIGTSKNTSFPKQELNNTNPIQTTIGINVETSTLEYTTIANIVTKQPTAVSTKVPAVLSTTATMEQQQHEENKIKSISRNPYCHCNLNLNVCDINCCCDADCTDNVLKVFDCNLKREISKLRHFDDFQSEQQELPPCGIDEGWLCVFRNNKKPSNTDKIMFISDTRDMYKWPDLLRDGDHAMHEKLKIADFYKFNEPLKLVNLKTKEIKHFELPFPFMTANCNLKIPLTHLKSRNYACPYKNLEKLLSNKQEIIQLMRETKILRTPKSQELMFNLIDDIKPFLGDITLHNCFNSAEEEQTLCTELNAFDNDTESQKEQYYSTEIIFKIYHNYTSIIEGIVVFIERELLDFANEENCVDIWQKFEVRFITKTTTVSNLLTPTKSAKQFSGPLGYLQGEPVIVTQLAVSNSSNNQPTLDYFDSKISKNTISLFTTRQSNCHKDNKHPINFGINEQKKCFLKLENNTNVFTSDTDQFNYTALCHFIQNKAWLLLFHLDKFDSSHSVWMHLNNLLISQLGRPQNKTNKWLPLHIHNFENAPLLASYDEKLQSFTCHNMLLSAAYEFHIGHFIEHGHFYQSIITQSTLVMGNLHDLEFAIDEEIKVPLTMSIMFYDNMLRSNAFIVNGYFSWQFFIPLLMAIVWEIMIKY